MNAPAATIKVKKAHKMLGLWTTLIKYIETQINEVQALFSP